MAKIVHVRFPIQCLEPPPSMGIAFPWWRSWSLAKFPCLAESAQTKGEWSNDLPTCILSIILGRSKVHCLENFLRLQKWIWHWPCTQESSGFKHFFFSFTLCAAVCQAVCCFSWYHGKQDGYFLCSYGSDILSGYRWTLGHLWISWNWIWNYMYYAVFFFSWRMCLCLW